MTFPRFFFDLIASFWAKLIARFFVLENFNPWSDRKFDLTHTLSGLRIVNDAKLIIQHWLLSIGFLQTSVIIRILLKKIHHNLFNLLWNFVIMIFVVIILWWRTEFSFEIYFRIETISVFGQNFSMPYLRNEF